MWLAVSAGQPDLDLIALQADGPHLQLLIGVFDALAVAQTEVLLVQRRSNHQLALELADNAATNHVGAGLGVAIGDGEQLILARQIP